MPIAGSGYIAPGPATAAEILGAGGVAAAATTGVAAWASTTIAAARCRRVMTPDCGSERVEFVAELAEADPRELQPAPALAAENPMNLGDTAAAGRRHDVENL